MPEKLLDVKGKIVFSGIHPGMPNQQIPLWEDGSNVLFEDSAVKPAPGQGPIFSKIATLPGLGLLTFREQDQTQVCVWGTRTSLYRGESDDADAVDVTRLTDGATYTGTDTNLWSIINYGDGVFATNGVDAIQYLAPGAANFVNLDTVSDQATTFRCKVLHHLGPFVLCYNTDTSHEQYTWCDEDDPFTWSITPEGEAGDAFIRDLGSEILAVEHLQEGHAVYGVHNVSYVWNAGTPFYFHNKHLMTGIGAVGIDAVEVIGNKHYGFGQDGIWVADGNEYQYIDSPSMHKFIYSDTLDLDKIMCVATWHDGDDQNVYFSYYTLDGSGFTVSYDYALGAFSMHDFHRTGAFSAGSWAIPVTLDKPGNVWGQGLRRQAASGTANPLRLEDSWTMGLGYGFGGYSLGTYGGDLSGS